MFESTEPFAEPLIGLLVESLVGLLVELAVKLLGGVKMVVLATGVEALLVVFTQVK